MSSWVLIIWPTFRSKGCATTWCQEIRHGPSMEACTVSYLGTDTVILIVGLCARLLARGLAVLPMMVAVHHAQYEYTKWTISWGTRWDSGNLGPVVYHRINENIIPYFYHVRARLILTFDKLTRVREEMAVVIGQNPSPAALLVGGRNSCRVPGIRYGKVIRRSFDACLYRGKRKSASRQARNDEITVP